MHLPPAPDATLEEFRPQLATAEASMGFRPNSMLTMARVPGLPQALATLAAAVFAAPRTSPQLKGLVAIAASQAAGCRYCQAHTAHRASHALGVDTDKLKELWSFENSALYSEAERAALRFALGTGQTPNAVTEAEFEALEQHFDADEIAELTAVAALFGFLNRWNDTLATTLEDEPRDFAERHLGEEGWLPGKHR